MTIYKRIPRADLSVEFDFRGPGNYRYTVDALRLMRQALEYMGYRGKWTIRYITMVKSRATDKIRITAGGYGVFVVVKPAGQDSAFKAQIMHPIEYTDSDVISSFRTYAEIHYGTKKLSDPRQPSKEEEQEALFSTVVAAASSSVSSDADKFADTVPVTATVPEHQPPQQEETVSKSLQGFINNEECVAIVLKALLVVSDRDSMVDKDIALSTIQAEVAIDASHNAIGGVIYGLSSRGYIVKHDELKKYEITVKAKLLVRKHYPGFDHQPITNNGKTVNPIDPGEFFAHIGKSYQRYLKGRELQKRLDDIMPRVNAAKEKKQSLERQLAKIKSELDTATLELTQLQDAIASWDGPSPEECKQLEQELAPFLGMLAAFQGTSK